MQVSCSGIHIIQSDTSVSQMLNVWHTKAYRRWIPSYNTKRNWQTISHTEFFLLEQTFQHFRKPYRSNLSFWTKVADQKHPRHYASPSSILPHNQ
jgi:hypothetical protein